jgi:4-hydroxybenzoate polyprenyltransferase
MTLLQFAIGVLNDLVDAPRDAGREPPKPIPAGLVTRPLAWAVALVAALTGLGLAAPSGPTLVLLALVVLGIGSGYDLLAKGTPWSWVPFAIGIPLLPVYGWFGATGALPSTFAVLLPMAVLAGAALAIANARADLDADAASGTRSVATVLGAERSWWVDGGLMVAAIAIGVAFLDRGASSAASTTLVVAGIGIVIAGLVVGRRDDRRARVRGWEAQAIGAAIAATGWVAAMTPFA